MLMSNECNNVDNNNSNSNDDPLEHSCFVFCHLTHPSKEPIVLVLLLLFLLHMQSLSLREGKWFCKITQLANKDLAFESQTDLPSKFLSLRQK